MNNTADINALLQKITLVSEEEDLPDVLTQLGPENIQLNARKPVRVAFVNAHALNMCATDTGFLRNLLDAEYVFRDGSGMKILYKMLGVDPGLNLNGTDLIPQIIERYKGENAALLGTEAVYLERAAKVIRSKKVDPILLLDGFKDDDAYLEAARRNPSALIILAMGMPKQERIAALLAENLDYPCLIICGGAILDFMSGKVTRAPALFRKFGMEWAYRLAQEPKRLFKRYVIGNFVFLLRSVSLAAPNKLVPAKSFVRK